MDSALPDSLAVLSKIASITIGANWVLNSERFKRWALGSDVDALQTLFGRRVKQEDTRSSHGTVCTVPLLLEKPES